MNILITGAAGFIGSALAVELLKSGNKVTGIDSLGPYYSQALKRRRVEDFLDPNEISFTKLDLTNLAKLRDYVDEHRPDTIIHLAAQPGVRLPVQENYRYSSANLVGFSNILQVAVEAGVTDFLYASSSSIYGDNSGGSVESQTKPNPSSYYGATKLANEILAESLKLHQIRMRALRLFTVYGPYGRPDMAYFKLMTSGKLGKDFHLYGDGSVTRDFTYISDVTKIVSELVYELRSRPMHFHDRVNLGGSMPRSMSELIQITQSYSKNEIRVMSREKQVLDVESTLADPTYLYSLIKYRHQIDLEAGLRIVTEWFDSLSIQDIQSWKFNEIK